MLGQRSFGICCIVLGILGGILSPSSVCTIIVGVQLACYNYQKPNTGCDCVHISAITGLVLALVQWASTVFTGVALLTHMFHPDVFVCVGGDEYCDRLSGTGTWLIVGSCIYYPILLLFLALAIRRSSPSNAAAPQDGVTMSGESEA